MFLSLPLAGIPRKQGRSRERQRVSWIVQVSVATNFFGTVVGAKTASGGSRGSFDGFPLGGGEFADVIV